MKHNLILFLFVFVGSAGIANFCFVRFYKMQRDKRRQRITTLQWKFTFDEWEHLQWKLQLCSLFQELRGNQLFGIDRSAKPWKHLFYECAFQYLRHTPKLVYYLLGGYAREINLGNPLGMDISSWFIMLWIYFLFEWSPVSSQLFLCFTELFIKEHVLW